MKKSAASRTIRRFMKKGYKAILIILSLLFAFSAFAGCDNKKENDKSDTEDIRSGEWDGQGELAKSSAYDLKIKVDGSAVAGLENNLINYGTNNSSVWFSGVSNTPSGEHFVALDLGRTVNVHKIGVTPYLFTDFNSATGAETQRNEISCFPKGIEVSYSIEYGKFSTVLKYENYVPALTVNENTDGTKYASDVEFGFDNYVTARYVKLTFTDMTDDKVGNYLVKLCNVKAYVTEASELDEAKRIYAEYLMPEKYSSFVVTASSVNDADPAAPFSIAALSDKNYSTYWCQEWMNTLSPETDDYVDIKTKNSKVVGFTKIVFVGLPKNESFPTAFDIQYNIGDTGFVTYKSYTDYKNPSEDNYNVFTFDKPLIADTIRFQARKKSVNSSGYYVFLLAEVESEANVVSDDEIKVAMQEHVEKLGQVKNTVKTDDKIVLSGLIALSVIITAVGICLFFIPFKKRSKTNED